MPVDRWTVDVIRVVQVFDMGPCALESCAAVIDDCKRGMPRTAAHRAMVVHDEIDLWNRSGFWSEHRQGA